MKFTLQGKIIFNKDAQNARKDIDEFITSSNEDLFLKGIPTDQKKDASQIVHWNLDKNTLTVKMVSGRRGRAHDALLRMKKPLSQILGPEYHLGIRKIEVEKYQIEITLPEKPELDKTTGMVKKGAVDLWATLVDKIIDMPYVSHSEITDEIGRAHV